MKFELGRFIFKSKLEARNRIKDILKEAIIKSKLDGDDKELLIELIKNHPEANRKIGCGIAEIVIGLTPQWKQKCFHIVRVDGSTTDFSYLVCFNPRTLHKKIAMACRDSVSEDILQFKKGFFCNSFMVSCPITADLIDFYSSDVDHEEPKFRDLISEWMRGKSITAEDINETEDNSYRTYFINHYLVEDFRNFHNKNAKLRVVSVRANREILR